MGGPRQCEVEFQAFPAPAQPAGLTATATASFVDLAWTAVNDNSVVRYLLERSENGGAVASSPPGINCPPDCSEVYPLLSVVTLNAVMQAGGRFDGWGADCAGTSMPPNPFDIDLTTDSNGHAVLAWTDGLLGTAASTRTSWCCAGTCREEQGRTTQRGRLLELRRGGSALPNGFSSLRSQTPDSFLRQAESSISSLKQPHHSSATKAADGRNMVETMR